MSPDIKTLHSIVSNTYAAAGVEYPPWAIGLARRAAEGRLSETDYLWVEPERIFTRIGIKPDPWQSRCLRSLKHLLLNCSRQVGKSFVTSAIAAMTILREPPSLVLILSPGERQSQELLKDKFMPLYEPWTAVNPLTKNNEFSKEFANGSRIIALPGKSDATIRSFSSVRLLIIDEASRVPDSIYDAVTPMLAVSKGRKLILSTPFGKRGFFYKLWSEGPPQEWDKTQITADRCPRLSPAFLASERREKGERVYKQEYECDFSEAVGQIFPEWAITASVKGAIDFVDLFNQDVKPDQIITTSSDPLQL